jgi:hypothetical protein
LHQTASARPVFEDLLATPSQRLAAVAAITAIAKRGG